MRVSREHEPKHFVQLNLTRFKYCNVYSVLLTYSHSVQQVYRDYVLQNQAYWKQQELEIKTLEAIRQPNLGKSAPVEGKRGSNTCNVVTVEMMRGSNVGEDDAC